MTVQIAITDEQIQSCYEVMKALRPHISQDEFGARVRSQQQDGYLLAYYSAEERPVAVAGFRLGKNLAWGKFLYVDDLVSLASERSRGYGKALLDWLKKYAKDNGCQQLHLDSGTQRKAAHKFYEREGVPVTSLHFTCELD